MRLEVGKRSPLKGKSLQELEKEFKKAVVIGCIIRDEEVIIPWGGTTVKEGDEVLIFCTKQCLARVHKLFNPPANE
jgi:Trk K+ transport system NAD-binding subunit